MTTTQELEALIAGCTPAPWSCGERADESMWLSIGQSSGTGAHYQFNFNGHYYADAQLIALAPTLAAELIKERANSALLLEACKLWIKYDSADENAFQLLMMNYANALNATKAAIKQAGEQV